MTLKQSGVTGAGAATTVFDLATAIVVDHLETGRMSADLDPAWSSFRGIHGGYVTAVAIRAAEAVVGDRAVRTITTSFLRPASPGPAEVRVEQLRQGRSISSLAVTISQSSRDIAVSRLTAASTVSRLTAASTVSRLTAASTVSRLTAASTVSRLTAASTVSPTEAATWDTAVDLGLPPIERCEPIAPPPGIGHFDHCDAMLDPADLPFSHGTRARVAGYVRPRQSRPIDAAWLGMALDWFPPASFTRVDPPIGGVSIDYTVHVHHTRPALAEGEWLRGEFHADISAGGIALEKGVLVDPSGHVLAESFHTRLTAQTPAPE